MNNMYKVTCAKNKKLFPVLRCVHFLVFSETETIINSIDNFLSSV